jgi:hypothetical protein
MSDDFAKQLVEIYARHQKEREQLAEHHPFAGDRVPYLSPDALTKRSTDWCPFDASIASYKP